jgi:hypothetical protein
MKSLHLFLSDHDLHSSCPPCCSSLPWRPLFLSKLADTLTYHTSYVYIVFSQFILGITCIPQLNLALISPSSEPIKPTTVTRKQIKLNVLRRIHFFVQAPIFFCTKYISTGKYMVKGQKFKAPNSPKTWLK